MGFSEEDVAEQEGDDAGNNSLCANSRGAGWSGGRFLPEKQGDVDESDPGQSSGLAAIRSEY